MAVVAGAFGLGVQFSFGEPEGDVFHRLLAAKRQPDASSRQVVHQARPRAAGNHYLAVADEFQNAAMVAMTMMFNPALFGVGAVARLMAAGLGVKFAARLLCPKGQPPAGVSGNLIDGESPRPPRMLSYGGAVLARDGNSHVDRR